MKAPLLGLAALLLAVLPALAQSGPRIDAVAAMEASEAAIGTMVGDHRLLRADGATLTMAEFRGQPLVVSLIYTSCATVCPVTTQTLKRAVAEARKALGAESFRILTVGFDARGDTPRRMTAFARDNAIAGDPLWDVVSGSPAALEALMDDVGFSYSGAAGGFEHISQTTIVDADGRVYRQVYGDEFPLQVFIEPLKELVFGISVASFTPAALADRLRFICTVYDPKTGRYRTDYAIYIGITAGAVSLILMGWVILRMWRGNRRYARLEARP
jgi:protein SCO1/2